HGYLQSRSVSYLTLRHSRSLSASHRISISIRSHRSCQRSGPPTRALPLSMFTRAKINSRKVNHESAIRTISSQPLARERRQQRGRRTQIRLPCRHGRPSVVRAIVDNEIEQPNGRPPLAEFAALTIGRLTLAQMDAASIVHRMAFDDRLPWLAGIHTPEEDRRYF